MAKLYFIYGAMNSGKSINLLTTSFNYQESGRSPLLLTSSLDKRFGESEIASRIGLKENATAIEESTNLYELYQEISQKKTVDVILCDEINFYTREQINQLADIVDYHDIDVLAYGLRTDFRTNSFEGSQRLLEIADVLREMITMCTCGRKCTMVAKLIDGEMEVEGPQVQVGDAEYTSLCRRCYKKLLREKQLKISRMIQ